MTKSLNGYEMAKETNTNCKIYVKSFSGATTADMEDYMKPSVRKSPDHFILQMTCPQINHHWKLPMK